ncbi:hypothetical protein XENOCAPTIV_001140 [Xenoophorus captivus]|uniref:Uncharacterized protein n=1 Tax=Xenoophorus captivus TaxID=1517983 RepID=A0ABV0R7J2_9TELE
MEEQRQLNKIFLQDFCNSDYIISPIDKHETQRSSVNNSNFQFVPYENNYHNLDDDESLRKTYELLACFKKDMHKVRKEMGEVETYLTVAKCRLSPEANCTL